MFSTDESPRPDKAAPGMAGADDITGGGLPRGRIRLLRRAQDRLRHSEAARQSAILDALQQRVLNCDEVQGFLLPA